MQYANQEQRPWHVAVIGGGISGLAAAYELQESARAAGLPLAFTLLESEPKLGGKIQTERAGEFTIEGGPDCFIRQKPWAAQLCHRLGIGGDLMGTNDARRKTYVLNRGRLAPLPDGVMLIIPTRVMPFVTSTLISWPGKIRMGMDLFLPRRKDSADESIGDFVRRRLGREALDKIAEPLLSGIHVSDPEQQSLLGTFPRFRNLENKHRSLIVGMLAQRREGAKNGHHAPSNGSNGGGPNTLFVTLKGGLGQMTAALEKALTGGKVLLNARVTGLEPRSEGGYRLTLADGRSLDADAVILSTPAYASGSLVNGFDPDLGKLLLGVRYVSTATISLAFRKEDAEGRLNGFGYVVPRKERREVSACTYVSTKFDHRAPEGAVLVRCFVGGPGHEEIVDKNDGELVALARQELAGILGIQAKPLLVRVYRWQKANPQYDVGHLERVARMKELCARHPGLALTGSAYDGVGIPDCVHQGQQAAQRIIETLQTLKGN